MRTRNSHHPLTRHERRFRRSTKRELIAAQGALLRFMLELHGGQLDDQPHSQLATAHRAVITRYRIARNTYAMVFGELAS